MTYPSGQVASGGPGRVRPGLVSASSYLLYVFAGLQLIGAILAFAYAGDISKVMKDAFANVDGGEAVATVTTVSIVGVTALGLVIAGGLAVLGIFNNRGKNGARITTWVIGGIVLCCCGANLASTAAGNAMNVSGQSSDPNVPTGQEIQDKLAEVLPGWYNTVSMAISVLALLALLAALILLALPPSNEFFRKPPAEWQPPAPGQPGYLAYPAYPAPGAPQAVPPTAPPAAGQPPAEPPAAGQPPAEPTPPGDQPRGDS